jgi:hypothetical protein
MEIHRLHLILRPDGIKSWTLQYTAKPRGNSQYGLVETTPHPLEVPTRQRIEQNCLGKVLYKDYTCWCVVLDVFYEPQNKLDVMTAVDKTLREDFKQTLDGYGQMFKTWNNINL